MAGQAKQKRIDGVGFELGNALLLDAAPDAMLVVNEQGLIALANAEAEKLFGYSRQQLIGESIETLIPPAVRIAHAAHRSSFFKDPRARPMGADLQLFAHKSDGSEIPVEISLSPLKTESGLFVISAIRDTTERRRAEEKFRGLMESAPDAMIIVDTQGRIARVNSQTERLFGYSRSDLLGKAVEILVPERYRAKHGDHREGFFHDPRVRPMGLDLELFGLKRDGSEFPVEISLSPLTSEKEEYVTAAIRDISERKRAEEKIRTLNRELQDKIADLAATNKELEAFSYSVSHDLRAPLRQIDGFSKILLEEAGEALPASQRDCLQEIRDGARHLGQLVDDLLNFSRLGRQALVIHSVDLNALLRSVISESQRDTPSRMIEWQIGLLPETNCDSMLMRQVFRNLIANAVKFTRTRQSAVIEVGHNIHNGRNAFFVRDNGVGFNMAFADKLFGVFQRLHLQEDFEGTGVGLAIVQRIILKHGGTVWAEAELNRGATFFFTVGDFSAREHARDFQDHAS